MERKRKSKTSGVFLISRTILYDSTRNQIMTLAYLSRFLSTNVACRAALASWIRQQRHWLHQLHQQPLPQPQRSKPAKQVVIKHN